MTPEQVIQSWLQDYTEETEFPYGGVFSSGALNDSRNPFDGTNYSLQEISEKQAIKSQEPILVFQNPANCSKKPFKVQDYEPFLLVGNNWGYSSFENELEGQEWDDRMTCWRAVNGLGPRTVPVKSNPKGVYYRLVRWIGNQPLLNWNRFPKELI